MAEIEAHLMGIPSISCAGKEITFPYKKAEALLYYLLVNRKVSRDELIQLLWTEEDPDTAHKNLRHAVYSIRKAFPFDLFQPGARSVVALDESVTVHSDADALLSGEALHMEGEFLKGFSVPKAEAFDEWLASQRLHIQNTFLSGLAQKSQEAFRGGDLPLAEQCCMEYMRTDSIEESNIALLMQIYYTEGKYRRAINLYNRLNTQLSEEFGISPLKETTALYYKALNAWNSSASAVDQKEESELIGKEHALRSIKMLCGDMDSVSACPGCLILGRAGVGKTYLIDYYLRECDFSGRLVCHVRCYPSESSITLAPWNSVMLILLQQMEAGLLDIPDHYLKTAACIFPCLSLNPAAEELGIAEGSSFEGDYKLARESALAILALAHKNKPLLLVFEDVHWMDTASAEMLHLLLRRMQHKSLKVLCTARRKMPDKIRAALDSMLEDRLMKTEEVANFSFEDTVRFIRQYAPDASFSGDVYTRIYSDTNGNPLLLVQLLNTLRDNKNYEYISIDAKNIIAARIEGLSNDERRLLDAVSVFREYAPFSVLASFMAKNSLDLACLCEQLCQKSLLSEKVENGVLSYCFSHERIKDYFCEHRTETASRILHLRIAQCFEEQSEVPDASLYAQLIYHYSSGGNTVKAFEFKVRSLDLYAGRCYELMPFLSADSAMPQYEEEGLLSYFSTLEEEVKGFRKSAGNDETVLDELEKILLCSESRFCVHGGYYEHGIECLNRLLSLCEKTNDDEMAVKAHLQYLYYAIQTYNRDVMRTHIAQGLALCDKLQDPPETGIFYRHNGLLSFMCGDNRMARMYFETSIQLFQVWEERSRGKYTINIAGAYNYIAETFRLEKKYTEAFHYYDLAVKFNKGRGAYPGAAIFYTDYGVAAFQQGNREKARTLFETAEKLCNSFHEISQKPITLSYLAYFNVLDGKYEEAAQRLKKAFSICRMLRSPWWAGISKYMCWKIREELEKAGQHVPALEAFWPQDKIEHCLLCLKDLRQLEPRDETNEMEAALAALQAQN